MGRARLPLPELGPEVPRAGGPGTRLLGGIILRAIGWRIEGAIPNLPQFVIIVAPHTSNWDFVIGVAAKLALGLQALWLGKDTIFQFPLGILMRGLGGMPVDRSRPNDVVNQVADRFTRQRQMVLALAPEGTRRQVERWRTGFYHIAHTAGVPIVPVALDWSRRAIKIMTPFATTDDVESDVARLRKLFEGMRGRLDGD